MYTKALAALAAFLVTSSASPISVSRRQTDNNQDSNNKRGICYKFAKDTFAFADSASWAYHWTSVPEGDLPEGMEFVPTLHPDEVQNGVFKTNAEKAIGSGSKHLLFLNEPDWKNVNQGGTNIGEAEAAEWYKSDAYQGTFGGRDDVKLGGPGPSAAGMDWMETFAGLCQGCQFDFIPLHFYDHTVGHDSAELQFVSFQGFMKENIPKIQQLFKKANGEPADIWITEFGYKQFEGEGAGRKETETVTDTVNQNAYMKMALEWLDDESDEVAKAIKRYAYFMSADGQLLNGGQPNEAGQMYAASS